MRGVFLWAMRQAAEILFVVALLLFVASVTATLAAGASLANATSLYAPAGSGVTLLSLVTAITGGLGVAVWPFFGAALVWRLDRSRLVSGAAE